MKQTGWSSFFAAVLLLALAACGGGTPPQASGLDEQAFIQQLRAKGATVVETGSGGQLPLAGTGALLKVNGEDVQVYAYPTADQATADTTRIAPDGFSINEGKKTIAIDWISIPHFYHKDRLIVFYLGANANMLALLEAILGPQFAGEE